MNGFEGERYLTTEGKIGTWQTVRPYDGDIVATNENAYFPNQQEAEKALEEFINNQKGEKEMKKSDLKNGMVVEMRDRDKYMVLKTRFFEAIVSGEEGYEYLSDYAEDLTFEGVDELDIVAIYEPQNAGDALENEWDYLEPIWERTELKELTVAEIEKQLGYKVKIIK